MIHIVLLLACLVMMPLEVQAGELFRWVDNAGKMNYGDVPPADATDIERLNISSEATLNDDLPYETRRAQENFPVTLYVGNGCGDACTQGRNLLSKRGIPYSEKLLQTREDIEAFKQLSGIDSVVPVLQVGKDFLKGYLESQWNGELDVAGYPKTASYRQRFAPPVKAEPFAPAPSAAKSAEGSSSDVEATPAQPAVQ
jgi:uncharacterized protein DUF4124